MTQSLNATPDPLEQQVLEHLQALFVEYLQMDDLADELLELQQQGKPIDSLMDRLRQGREQILELENRGSAVMRQYRETRDHSSAAVNQLIDQTRQKIEQLMLKIATLEKSAQKAYQQLVPEIDHGVRGNQMKQAYGNSF